MTTPQQNLTPDGVSLQSSLSGRTAYSVLIAAVLLSRCAYYVAGIRFDSRIIETNFQFIDTALLRNRFWESLFYYHMQPPGFNALVGLLIKGFPESYPSVMAALYLLCGIGSACMTYWLMRVMHVRPMLALGINVVFWTTPGVILFETFPMYEYPIMTLLLAACCLLVRMIRNPNFQTALLFFSVLTALSWIRSIFHPLYYLLVLGAILLVLKRRRTVVAAAFALPFASILALFTKNLIVFGLFSSSSWLGTNLGSTCTSHQLSPEELRPLIATGKVHPIAAVEGPSAVSEYRRFFPDLRPTGVPVLDQERKSNGALNTNHLIYLHVDRLYMRVAKEIMRYRPVAYARSVTIAWFGYFLPPTYFFQFEERREHIRTVNRLYNVVLFGQFMETSRAGLRQLKAEGKGYLLPLHTGVFLMIGLPALLLCGLYQFWRSLHARNPVPVELAVLGFILFNITFIMMTSNFLSSFETNRYRFPTDALYAILLGITIEQVRRWRDIRRNTLDRP